MTSALRLRKEGSRKIGKRTRGFMHSSRPDSILNPGVDTHVNMVSTYLSQTNTVTYNNTAFGGACFLTIDACRVRMYAMSHYGEEGTNP